MKPVARNEIVDYCTYEEKREAFRKEVLAEKARRRIHVGEYLTFLFENTLTIRYQIQEMMRIEQIVRERDILHEIATYNEILGGDGELGCTLMIEIDDNRERDLKLREQVQLPQHLYALMNDDIKIYPRFDAAHQGNTRLALVQYLKFPVGGLVPEALGIDLPGYEAQTTLTQDQKSALREDLRADQR